MPVYVRSGAAGLNNGTSWTDAYTAISSTSGAAAGTDIWVAQDHNEDPGADYSIDWTNGTEASPIRIISVDHTTDNYSVGTSPQINNGTGSYDVTFSADNLYVYGLYIECGDDFIVTGLSERTVFTDCIIDLVGSGSAFSYGNASGSNRTTLYNTDINFTNATGGSRYLDVANAGWFEMYGGSVTYTGTQPSRMFDVSTRDIVVYCEGVDFSSFTGGDLISPTNTGNGVYKFVNCLKSSSATYCPTAIFGPRNEVEFYGCSDTTTNELYEIYRADYHGATITDDTVYRTGGASDGTTGISWKMVCDSSRAWEFDGNHKSPWIEGWINSTGSKTFTCHFANNSATSLQDDEIWLEVQYLGASTSPIASMATDRVADILATPANQATSTESWTGLGGTNTKQQLVVTQTVNRVGPFRARVHLAKPSQTVYVCPKIEVS